MTMIRKLTKDYIYRSYWHASSTPKLNLLKYYVLIIWISSRISPVSGWVSYHHKVYEKNITCICMSYGVYVYYCLIGNRIDRDLSGHTFLNKWCPKTEHIWKKWTIIVSFVFKIFNWGIHFHWLFLINYNLTWNIWTHFLKNLNHNTHTILCRELVIRWLSLIGVVHICLSFWLSMRLMTQNARHRDRNPAAAALAIFF